MPVSSIAVIIIIIIITITAAIATKMEEHQLPVTTQRIFKTTTAQRQEFKGLNHWDRREPHLITLVFHHCRSTI